MWIAHILADTLQPDPAARFSLATAISRVAPAILPCYRLFSRCSLCALQRAPFSHCLSHGWSVDYFTAFNEISVFQHRSVYQTNSCRSMVHRNILFLLSLDLICKKQPALSEKGELQHARSPENNHRHHSHTVPLSSPDHGSPVKSKLSF